MEPTTQEPSTNQPTITPQQPVVSLPPQPTAPVPQVPYTTEPPKKSHKKLFIIIGAVIVVVVAILIASFILGSSKVNDWLVTNSIVEKTTVVKQDVLNVGQDGEQQNASQLLTDCQKLVNDSEGLVAIPSGPNPTLNSELSKAADTISGGAKGCVTSIDNADSSGLGSAIEQVTDGTNQLAIFVNNAKIFLK